MAAAAAARGPALTPASHVLLTLAASAWTERPTDRPTNSLCATTSLLPSLHGKKHLRTRRRRARMRRV